MTRKDFELIVEVIRNARGNNEVADTVLDSITHRFAGALASTNPNFNKQLFIDKCGYKA